MTVAEIVLELKRLGFKVVQSGPLLLSIIVINGIDEARMTCNALLLNNDHSLYNSSRLYPYVKIGIGSFERGHYHYSELLP